MVNPNPILAETFTVYFLPPDTLQPDGGGGFLPEINLWDAAPTISIFQDGTGNGSPMAYSPAVLSDTTSTFSFVTIVATLANGFQAGKSYNVFASGTANGHPVSVAVCAFILRTGVNVVQWNGTTVPVPDTAGYPKVTHKVGTGTGEINLASGKVPATLAASDVSGSLVTQQNVDDIAAGVAGQVGTPADVWAYADRKLTSGGISVVQPWQAGSLSVIKGNSYLSASGTAISITKAASATWPSDLYTGGYTITFTCTPTAKTLRDVSTAAGFITTTGTATSATAVRLGDMSVATTGTLSIPAGNGANAYTYEVTASKSAGTVVYTLERGTMTVG